MCYDFGNHLYRTEDDLVGRIADKWLYADGRNCMVDVADTGDLGYEVQECIRRWSIDSQAQWGIDADRFQSALLDAMRTVVATARGEVDEANIDYGEPGQDADHEDGPVFDAGCNEFDTTDSRGRPLRPAMNEAGEAWWL